MQLKFQFSFYSVITVVVPALINAKKKYELVHVPYKKVDLTKV